MSLQQIFNCDGCKATDIEKYVTSYVSAGSVHHCIPCWNRATAAAAQLPHPTIVEACATRDQAIKERDKARDLATATEKRADAATVMIEAVERQLSGAVVTMNHGLDAVLSLVGMLGRKHHKRHTRAIHAALNAVGVDPIKHLALVGTKRRKS